MDNKSSAFRKALCKWKNHLPEDFNRQDMEKFYSNCPKGMIVSPIEPGKDNGEFHPDNFQYVTNKEQRIINLVRRYNLDDHCRF